MPLPTHTTTKQAKIHITPRSRDHFASGGEYGVNGTTLDIYVSINGDMPADEAEKLVSRVHKAAVAKFEALTKPKIPPAGE